MHVGGLDSTRSVEEEQKRRRSLLQTLLLEFEFSFQPWTIMLKQKLQTNTSLN